MARYLRRTQLARAGFRPNLDTIEEIASALQTRVFETVELDGFNLKFGKYDGTFTTINLTPLFTDGGSVDIQALVDVNLYGNTITFTNADNSTLQVDLTPLGFVKDPQLVGDLLRFTGADGSTIDVDLNKFNYNTAISSITDRVSTDESIIDSVVDSLATRLSNGDNVLVSLTNRISSEESVRSSSDNSLTTRLSSEESTRLSADEILSSQLSNSDNTRISQVDSLGTAISNISEYDDVSINDRVSNLENADDSLSVRIDNLSGSTYNDTSINLRVSEIEDDINSISGSTFDDSSLTTRITNIEQSTTTADRSLETLIQSVSGITYDDSLVNQRLSSLDSVDGEISSSLSSEESIRLSSDQSLETRINNLSGSTYNDTSINDRVSALEDADISLTNVDQSLETLIQNTSGNTYDDSSLVTRVSETEDSIVGILNGYTSADVSLETRINNLSGSTYNDTSINDRVSSLEVSSDSADQSLSDRIDSLSGVTYDDTSINERVSNLENQDSTTESTLTQLQSVIEATSGITYDDTPIITRLSESEVQISTTLSSSISSDESLEALIQSTSGVTYDDSSLASEVSGLESVDISLETRINNLSGSTYNDTSINDRVSALEDADVSLETLIQNSSGNTYDDTTILSGITSLAAVDQSLETLIQSVSGITYDDSSLVSRLSAEEDTRISQVDSIDNRFVSLSGITYDDTSLVTRLVDFETTTQSVDQSLLTLIQVTSGITYDDSELITRLSSLEEVQSADQSGLDSRVSSLESNQDSLITVVGNINEYNDTSINERVTNLESTTTSVDVENLSVAISTAASMDESRLITAISTAASMDEQLSVQLNAELTNNLSLAISTSESLDQELYALLSSQIVAGDNSTYSELVQTYNNYTLGFGQTSYVITEGDTLTISITKSVDNTGGELNKILVDYSLETLSADLSNDIDFLPLSGTVEFYPSDTIKFIQIPIIDDLIVEGNEQFRVNLSNQRYEHAGIVNVGGEITFTNQITLVTITDNDNYRPATVEFTASNVNVNEGNDGTTGDLTLTITRSLGSGNIVPDFTRVDYTTNNGSAVSGIDFIETSGTIEFTNTENSKTITIPIIGNNTVDGDRSFDVVLSNPQGDAALLGLNSTTTVTINENDSYYETEFNIESTSILEGDSGSSFVVVTVNRTFNGGNVTPGDETVDYSTIDLTAIAGQDYVTQSGTLTFTDMDIIDNTNGGSKTFNIEILGDLSVENNETFNVVISNPTSVNGSPVINTSTTTITITNDDELRSSIFDINQSTYSISEGDNGVQVVTVQINKTIGIGNVNPSGPITVDYRTVNGNAVGGVDYVSLSGTLDFTTTTVQTVDITINGDMVVESDELFTFEILNPQGQGAVLGSVTQSTITILNDDVEPTPTPTPLPTATPTPTPSSGSLSYLIMADNGFTADDVQYNGTGTGSGYVPFVGDSQPYPFTVSPGDDWTQFINDRLVDNDRITVYTHDAVADNDVVYSFTVTEETPGSGGQVHIFYLYPASQGIITQSLDVDASPPFDVAGVMVYDTTVNGEPYKIVKLLQNMQSAGLSKNMRLLP